MKIFFTKRAEKNYRSIKKFITAKWGARIFNLFETKTIDFLDLLQEFPEIGTVEYDEKQIRGFQLSRQIRVFYRVKALAVYKSNFGQAELVSASKLF